MCVDPHVCRHNNTATHWGSIYICVCVCEWDSVLMVVVIADLSHLSACFGSFWFVLACLSNSVTNMLTVRLLLFSLCIAIVVVVVSFLALWLDWSRWWALKSNVVAKPQSRFALKGRCHYSWRHYLCMKLSNWLENYSQCSFTFICNSNAQWEARVWPC